MKYSKSLLFLTILLFIVIASCSPQSQNDKTWLFMLYLSADNNLEDYALMDINLIEHCLYNQSAAFNRQTKIVALVDRHSAYSEIDGNWTGSRIYELQADSDAGGYLGTIRSTQKEGFWGSLETELHMGDPATLSDFISWCKTKYPGYKYQSLTLWGHGAGVRAGICYDDSHDYDPLYLDEIQQVLDDHYDSASKLDLLHLQGCLMGGVEVAYEYRNLVDYIVAPVHIGGAGYPFFENLFDAITYDIQPSELATLTVQQYRDTWKSETPHYRAMTAIDLTNPAAIENLKNAIDTLGVALYQEDNIGLIQTVRDRAINYYSYDVNDSLLYPYYELGDLCANIISEASLSVDLHTKAQLVQNALAAVVQYTWADTNIGNYEGTGSDVKQGLSIFFSRGEQLNSTWSHYSSHWWYTNLDVHAWKSDRYYGYVDFCGSNTNGIVETWRELFEIWYDQTGDGYTPGDY